MGSGAKWSSIPGRNHNGAAVEEPLKVPGKSRGRSSIVRRLITSVSSPLDVFLLDVEIRVWVGLRSDTQA